MGYLKFFLLAGVIPTLISAEVQITLYKDINFGGSSLNITFDRCINLPNYWKRQVSGTHTRENCVKFYDLGCCQGKSIELYPGTLYHEDFKQLNFNDQAVSVSPCGDYRSTPPDTLQENWLSHSQPLHKVYSNEDLAVYYDSNMDDSVNWQIDFLNKAWKYVKTTYGYFGPDNSRLYAVFHPEIGASYPTTYLGAGWNPDICMNIVDCKPHDGGRFSHRTSRSIDIMTHEMSHIVEFASKGIKGSPSYHRWGDSQWAEIFQYDVYLNIGMHDEAVRWNQSMANSHWYRDWFYPIYANHGGASVLNRYFDILANNFVKRDANAHEYARDVNMGEFVHFWSAAAGRNLKELATTAFGWETERENQFNQARREFVRVTSLYS